ncbi:MAG: DUF4382 domain-containing protein, partial [Myxococcales bacterium]
PMKTTVRILAAPALSACGGGARAPLSLSVKAATATGADAAPATAAQIDHIHVTVSRLKLEGDAEVELSQGPFDVDLTGASLGSVEKVFDASVPAGTYRELRFDISSILVEGTFGAEAFSFSADLTLSQKKEGRFVVGADSSNITLSIDASKWFGALDPRDAANRAAIEANIRGSFDAFQDDDRSGHDDADDDHGEHADAGPGDDSGPGSDDSGDDHGGHGGDDHSDGGHH